jgi:apolipoprotein N-acyltransferase
VPVWRGLAQPVRYATLLAGALPVLAFPEPDLEFLAWFGLVPGFALIRLAPCAREAAVRGWWLGAGYLLAALYWLIPNIGPAWLLVAIVLGAPWAGVGYAVWRLLDRRPDEPQPPAEPARQADHSGPRRPGPGVLHALAGLAVVPSGFVVIEWLRSWQGIGGPWAVYGASQWQHPAVLALAAAGGIWLVSFALVLANTGIAIAIFAISWPARLTGAAAAAVAVAAGPIAFALMSAPAPAAGPAGRLPLALVQPGLVPGGPAALIADEARLTAGVRGADLVVWGESSLGEDLAGRHLLLASLRRLATAAPLLVSQDAFSPDGSHSKVAVLIGPGGVEGTYVKTRLVPFGEYIPLRAVLGWLTKISRAAQVNMISGQGAKVLQTSLPDGRRLAFGVLICFESSFPDMARVDTEHGAQVIIYQTSDSTFQGSWAPAQHASLGALRAAETGRPVVQAALTGDSAAFDARGRLLAWAGTSERGVLRVTLTLTDGRYATPYDRLGDYVPPVAIGVAVLVIGGPAVVRRFRRR